MSLAPNPNNILLGRGEILFDRHTAAGVRQGYFHLGNCNRFAIQVEDDVIDLQNSMDAEGGVYQSATRSRAVRVEINANEHAVEQMALALMGETSTFTQASSAITGEILTSSVVAGRYYKTANRSISGVVVTQGTATLTNSVDYVVHDASMGTIRFVSGAGAVTATAATVAYTRASLSLDMLLGATKMKIQGSVLFVPDPVVGPQYDVEIWKTAVSPTGDMDLISNEFGEFTLNLKILDDRAGGFGGSATCPYFRKIQRGVA
jgi:hypothetical protein